MFQKPLKLSNLDVAEEVRGQGRIGVGKGKVPEEESLFHMYFLELCHLRALAFYAVDLGIGSRFISENPPEILLHLDSCSQEGYAV